MKEATKNKSVDGYIRKNKQWQAELTQLRDIVLACELNEEIKWMHPCYTRNGKNIVLIHEFKDYCALLFFKGALLKDEAGILVQQTENVQAGRQLRFAHVDEIVEMAHIIRAYIQEAIAVEASGIEFEYKDTTDFDMPAELETKFEDDPDYKAAFAALTPGRQRGYLLYFSGAKQSKTRTSRIERYREKIFAGKGHNEQ